jgi:hypothetical protein
LRHNRDTALDDWISRDGGLLSRGEMPDIDAAQCWQRAEACRRLVELADNPERKALWAERADYWVQLALETEKQPPPPEQP